MNGHLKYVLAAVANFEAAGDHTQRNEAVQVAVTEAYINGIPSGYAYDNQPDPEFDGFRIVAYIELPGVGQVSWHLPEHSTPWDGHTTEEKYDRIRRFIRGSEFKP